MRSNLSNVDWEQFLDCKSVNEKWGRFKTVIPDVQCKFIPKVQKSKLRELSPQCMNKAVRKSLRKKKKLYKIHKKDSTESNKAEYCNIHAKVKK